MLMMVVIGSEAVVDVDEDDIINDNVNSVVERIVLKVMLIVCLC